MEKFIKYLPALLTLILSVSLAACGNDEPPAGDADMVYVSSGANTTITLEYDDSESLNAIKFEATGDWASDTKETNSQYVAIDGSAQPNWIAMYPGKGNAGSWSCELLTTPNRSTSPRYAVITVSSAKNSVSFKVKQNGMPSSQGGVIVPNPGE